jgi:hypothetical protein
MDDTPSEPPAGGDGPALEWADLCSVYRAPDESSAIHVTAMLRSAGIAARIRSAQIPAFDGAFAMAVGYWGTVMVPREEYLRARELVELFSAEAERGGPELRWPPPEMGATGASDVDGE